MSAVLTLVVLLLASLYFRVQNNQRNESHNLPEQTKASPFSNALQQLVAHAGGIYLSLVLLVSFLQIELASQWEIFDVKMEPLAFMSIVVAIFQPLILTAYRTIRGS